MKLYVIKNWETHYEKAQSRNVKHVSWVPLPVKHDGKSYRRLMALPDGLCLYGAWVLIVQVAAKCTPRGHLVDEHGPLTAEDLAIKTGAPEATFERALEVISSERIGWILVADYERAMSALPLQDKTDTTSKTGHTSATADADATDLRLWLEWWNGLRAESLVDVGVDAESPSQAVRAGWSRVQKSTALRELLADRDAIEREIRQAPFCREGWFRLEKLFGAKNRAGEYIVKMLLDGAYRQRSGGKDTSVTNALEGF